jgi:hypothetical protein
MRIVFRFSSALLLLSVGYACGANGLLYPASLEAQAEPAGDLLGQEPSESNQEKIREAYAALKSAGTSLATDDMYKLATQGVNGFAVTVGGVDAMADLENGRGVDPETFAALYAGMGIDDVVAELDNDEQGRLRYKGKVIRMYPISKLKQLYARRMKYSGEGGKTNSTP